MSPVMEISKPLDIDDIAEANKLVKGVRDLLDYGAISRSEYLGFAETVRVSLGLPATPKGGWNEITAS